MAGSSQPSHLPKQRETTSGGRGTNRTTSGLNQRFVDFLGWIITAAWALSMLFQAISNTYDPPMSIHFLMTAVAGSAFGTNFIRRPTNGADNDDQGK